MYTIPIYQNEQIQPNTQKQSEEFSQASLDLSKKVGTPEETQAFIDVFAKLINLKFIVPLYNKDIFINNNTLMAFTDYAEYQTWDALNGEVRAQFIILNYFELRNKISETGALLELNYTLFDRNNMQIYTKFTFDNLKNLESLYIRYNSKDVDYMLSACGILPELYEALVDARHYFDNYCEDKPVTKASLGLASNMSDLSDPDKILVVECNSEVEYLAIETELSQIYEKKYGTPHPQGIKIAYYKSSLAEALNSKLENIDTYINTLKSVLN
ncbi:MAG: hypothetical protein E7354_03780 [Clostridiales bacterium]|nr:hypothetical protein [Clostridiales bacterium]